MSNTREMQKVAEIREAELASFLASLPDDVFLKIVTDIGLVGEEDEDAGEE